MCGELVFDFKIELTLSMNSKTRFLEISSKFTVDHAELLLEEPLDLQQECPLPH